MKKVGIYSGTFDPVHDGHLAFASKAVDECGLDKVFFLVEPQPRRKQGIKAYEHRLEMVRLATQNNPKFGVIILGQSRFTVEDTLPKLQARFKGAELHMLLGDDMLAHFSDWPKLDELLAQVSFAIGLRHHAPDEIEQKIRTIEQTRGTKIRYKLVEVSSDVSSSRIKSALKKGESPAGLPSNVAGYIKNQGLYSQN